MLFELINLVNVLKLIYIRFIKYAYFKFYLTRYTSQVMIKKIFNIISIHTFIRNKVHCHIKLIRILKEVFILN